MPDGRSSGGGQGAGNRLSAAAAIGQRIGKISVPSSGGGSAAENALSALARNDMAVHGGIHQSLSARSSGSNGPSVSFVHGPPVIHGGSYGSTGVGTNGVVGFAGLPPPAASSGPSSLSGSGGVLDTSGGVVEPLDYEEYVQQQHRACGRANMSGRGPASDGGGTGNDDRLHLIDFPADDIEVNVVPRKIRTVRHVVPEESM